MLGSSMANVQARNIIQCPSYSSFNALTLLLAHHNPT
jgi:hypothetical protein